MEHVECPNVTVRKLNPLEGNIDDFFLIIMGCLVFCKYFVALTMLTKLFLDELGIWVSTSKY